MTDLAEKVVEKYGEQISRKTIGIDIGLQELIDMIEEVRQEQGEKVLPTAAVIGEKPDGDIKLLWNKENSATGIIKDELVRRKDHREKMAEFGIEKFKAGIKKEREKVVELVENKIENSGYPKERIKLRELLEEISDV